MGYRMNGQGDGAERIFMTYAAGFGDSMDVRVLGLG
jgi:hypothetical protein